MICKIFGDFKIFFRTLRDEVPEKVEMVMMIPGSKMYIPK